MFFSVHRYLCICNCIDRQVNKVKVKLKQLQWMTIAAQIKLLIVHSVNCIRSPNITQGDQAGCPPPAPPPKPLQNTAPPTVQRTALWHCKVPDVRLHVTQTRRSGIQIHDQPGFTMQSEVSMCSFWRVSTDGSWRKPCHGPGSMAAIPWLQESPSQRVASICSRDLRTALMRWDSWGDWEEKTQPVFYHGITGSGIETELIWSHDRTEPEENKCRYIPYTSTQKT